VNGQFATGRPARMLVFSQWSKNRFFVPQGRHVALINVTFGKEERTCSPLPLAKCHVYRGKNVGIQRLKLSKIQILARNLYIRGDSFAIF